MGEGDRLLSKVLGQRWTEMIDVETILVSEVEI
jgi:hypothetical protein